jgi:hypothetical protein
MQIIPDGPLSPGDVFTVGHDPIEGGVEYARVNLSI